MCGLQSSLNDGDDHNEPADHQYDDDGDDDGDDDDDDHHHHHHYKF